ncbi:mediator of RNA polymerase II transcription subunit 26-like [Thalassophryne amazonica]|uniref:mediator of RNA polymerase II transcription subunit 26-like n=1 Tax=Thalassophryne amazonica TaxID=390379 RepID=UPI001470FC79|nr:mediator of RNA polymerase II transcription subunit 26-like [Thalassophryne amazonica]
MLTSWVIRERLLRAIDSHSNICNMAVVAEMISVLEGYPMTTKILEETRLGKIINDIRKKYKQEDVGKRAKMLVQKWQNLIQPQKTAVLLEGHTVSSQPSSAGTHPCMSTPAASPPAGRTAPQSKNTHDFNCSSEVNILSKKRKADGNNELPTPLRISKKTENTKALNSKWQQKVASAQTSSRGHQQTRISHASSHSPNTTCHKVVVTQCGPPAGRPVFVERSGLGCSLPLEKVDAQNLQSVFSNAKDLDSQSSSLSRSLTTPIQNSNNSSRTDEVICEDGGPVERTEEKKLQKCKHNDRVLNLDRQTAEDRISGKLKERTPTSEQVRWECKPSIDMCQREEIQLCESAKPSCSPHLNQSAHFPLSTYQRTPWTHLNRSKSLQPYPSRTQESTMPNIMGVQTPFAQTFMELHLKEEEAPKCKILKKTHEVASDLPAMDLPGTTREVNRDDLNRLHTTRWSGVNGCYDFMGNWFDWTQSMSLDVHGDDSSLHILPYVSLY